VLTQIVGRWGLPVALPNPEGRDRPPLIEGERPAQEVVLDGDTFGGRVGRVFFF